MKTEKDVRDYLTDYPRQVAFGEEPSEVVFDRYHTAGFVLTNDGLPLDRGRLLAHVRPARRRATGVRVEVHHALVDHDRIAAHYTLTATMRSGVDISTEIFAFGRLSEDGRLSMMEQATRPLTEPSHGVPPAAAMSDPGRAT